MFDKYPSHSLKSFFIMTQEQEPQQLSGRDQQALEIGRRELADREGYERMMDRLRRFVRTPYGIALSTTAGIIAVVGAYWLGNEMGGEGEREPVRVFRETPTPESTQLVEDREPTPFPTATPYEFPTPTSTPAVSPAPEGAVQSCLSLSEGEACARGNIAVRLKSHHLYSTSLGEEILTEWEFKNSSRQNVDIFGLTEDNFKVEDNVGNTYEIERTILYRFESCKFVGDPGNPILNFSLGPNQGERVCLNFLGPFNTPGLAEFKVTFNKEPFENITWNLGSGG